MICKQALNLMAVIKKGSAEALPLSSMSFADT
jgi:hypothetical protein